MHIKTIRGLTHKVFPINIGTNIFSSDCWIIVYKITTARNHRHQENISADIAAGSHHKNGPRYGIISNKPANIARVHFCGMLILNNSKIRNQAYDIIQINKHKKS
jgi:hypothetical protein